MVIRYKKKSPKQRRTVMAISLVITVILILVASLGGLLVGASYILDQSLSDPDVLVHPALSGNDIVVTIYEGRRLSELMQLSLEIEGYAPVVRDVPSGAKEVIYVGIASQITGTRNVGVRGIFTDGSIILLKVIQLRFT
eukprot:TRINITY_DN9474_c0_g2_i1.p1 TRINITY_DN9474_c0_g2~~TRINITY_DN9474_c0_g2_i1.p1  ORF type:complete len:139 (+),score=14.85 TRINITY_DN9474_c0_g2_i1:53-469(+)